MGYVVESASVKWGAGLLRSSGKLEDESAGDVHEDEGRDNFLVADAEVLDGSARLRGSLREVEIEVCHVELARAGFSARLVCLLVVEVDEVIDRVNHV